MKTSHITAAIAASILILNSGSLRADDKEKTITAADVPAPAMEMIKKELGAAKIEKVSKEMEGGKVAYEATTTVNGKTREVSVDASGKLLSDEQVIDLTAAPAPVRSAIEKQGGKVEKVERVKENGKITYEAQISMNGQREEVVFSEAGKLEKTEKKGGKDKEDKD